MSIYKPKNSPFYQFDFRCGGSRFHGSTGSTNKREAETVERAEKEKAQTAVKAAKSATGGPLTIDAAGARYWLEVGSLHANSKTTFTDIGRLVDYFGPTKFLADITDDDVARMVQWRRSHRKNGRDKDRLGQPTALLSPATVNRSTTEVLKKLFTRAKRTWKQQFPNEPNWADHKMKEPTERVRELHKSEGAALKLATRSDFAPILAFAGMTGLRMRECLLKWSSVDFGAGRITTTGKGGKLVTTSITPAVLAILEPLVGNNPTWVFTFRAERTRDGRTAGKRYPITYNGLVSQWRRLRAKADVPTFRFHDFRHDVGTKLLRATGNLKLVQQALNHSDIKTTTRYAHVLDSEVATAMQKLAESQSDSKSRTKSRKGIANE